MAESITTWAPRTSRAFNAIPQRQMTDVLFFRDPSRPRLFDRWALLSPADGIILYQVVAEPHEAIEIKGQHFTLADLMEDFEVPTGPCLCIAIFMTYADVHVNRIPSSGILQFQMLRPIETYNRPMLFVENELFSGDFPKSLTGMAFENYNARMVNKIIMPELDYAYWLIQIADDEVNVVTHFTTEQNAWFDQGQRFSFVRWGSQVNLIMPLDQGYDLQPLVPDQYHVEGGLDPLIRIIGH